MAVAWRHIGNNPLASLRPLRHDSPAKQRRSLSLAEVQALFTHSPAYLRPVWQLLMTTGLGKRELANLVFDSEGGRPRGFAASRNHGRLRRTSRSAR